MANKLNAFLASVPANGLPSPVGLKGSAAEAPTSLKAPVLPELSLKAPEESESTAAAATPRKGNGIRAVQPATPQPQKQRRHANRRNNKSFERHFSTSDSARNISFPPGNEKNRVGNGDDDNNAGNVDNGSSNQEEVEQHKQQQAMTPLKAFNPKQQRQKAGANGDGNKQQQEQQQLISNESEAGPLRRLSAQGSHHRRVSTDTTMFNRYLRQQADRDINMDVVRHFSGVPVVTISRNSAPGGASSATFNAECNSEPKNNNDEDSVDNNSSNSDCCTIDPSAILAVFRRGGAVSTASALEILKQATNLMSLEQNVIAIQAPYTLVGDLHGQFQDLLEIFQVHGVPSATNPFLFLGDYVDRGISSCEIVLLLLAFKVTFPTSVHMLRGNHECRSLSTFYGFRAECLRKYGTLVYNRMVKCFESMPLAAKLETSYGTFLAVHGGLSPEIGHIEDINEQVNRFMEPEPNGALCDLLWADPAKESSSQDEEWRPNSVRGCSFTFSERACREFLKRNELLAIIRAHELEEDGFREHFNASQRAEKSSSDADEDDSESSEFAVMKLPPVITVFSAPEYCNTNHNMGATLVVPWERRANVLEFRQHKRSVHREHEFELPSEDQAVKNFLRETLPFLPVDFYELIMHCRQLKQTLMLSIQSSSMSQLPLAAMGFGTLPLAESSDSGSSNAGHTSKSAFALEIGTVTRRPSDVVVSSSKSHALESKDLQAQSGHSTTEEHSAVDREETEEDALSAELGRLSSSSSRQKRRKQQQKSKQDGPDTQLPASKTAVAVQSTLSNVQVLARPLPATLAAAHHTRKPPPRSNNRTILGGWKLCPGFLRFCDRIFGSKTNSATDLRSSVPAVALETGDSEDVDNNNRRASLTTEPMNNQLNSSEDPGSPVAVSPSSSLTALSATGAQLLPLSQQHIHMATDAAVPMQLESLFPGHQPKGSEVFSKLEWQALKLYFTLLDVSGNGVLMEESFVVLLAEQDSDAYATEDELTLLMEVIDTNADGLITEQDFLLFAYRSYLRWKKSHKKLGL